MEDYINCCSCGSKSLNIEGHTHEYMLSAPGCYAMFEEVLEKEYSDMHYARAHHYNVDTYAVQHPGDPSNPKAINSVGIHLVSLHSIFRKGMKISQSAEVKTEFARFNKAQQVIYALTPPTNYELTIFEVWDNEDSLRHFDLCQSWARHTWEQWESQFPIIESWIDQFLENTQFSYIQEKQNVQE